MPRSTTMLSLIGSSPARSAASADATGSSPKSRRAIAIMRSGSKLSTLMFTRSRPASRISDESAGSRTPFVDSAMSLISGTARSIRINSWICGRIVGSPPVIRRRRNPSGASWRTTAVISSYERISDFGSHGIPSAGMQYTQRKLQRSVTEMRRYSIERPNWSIAGRGSDMSFPLPASRVDPLTRPIDVMLELPDRHAFLELLDDVAARVVSGATVRMRDGDCNARVAQIKRTESVLDCNVVRRETLTCFFRDVCELAFRHRAVRRVL